MTMMEQSIICCDVMMLDVATHSTDLLPIPRSTSSALTDLLTVAGTHGRRHQRASVCVGGGGWGNNVPPNFCGMYPTGSTTN